MATQLIRGDVIEVPLPSDYQDQTCLPLVIMQPTADATNYMLKSTYATNGQPGVVDHAIVANTANAVDWNNILDLPATFPPSPHAGTHLPGGSDPLGLATPLGAGLMPQGSGNALQYYGGDVALHNLPGVLLFRSEQPANVDASFTAGSVICQGIVQNPAPGVYTLMMPYIYDANQNFPPAGWVHVDIYDPTIPGWVQVTQSTQLSALVPQNSFIALILLSGAMTRVWAAAANSLTWRLVLDTPAGTAAYFTAGVSFYLTGRQTL
jgi:hypothetical protein